MAIRQSVRERDYLLLNTLDDTEDSPWLVMGDPQWHAVDQFMSVLNLHVRRRRVPWYTASYMKITMRRPDGRPLDVAPDAFKVEADPHWRQSYDVDAEGKPRLRLVDASGQLLPSAEEAAEAAEAERLREELRRLKEGDTR